MATLLERIPYIYGKVPAAFLPEHFILFRTFTDDLHIKLVRIFTELEWEGSGKDAAGTFP